MFASTECPIAYWLRFAYAGMRKLFYIELKNDWLDFSLSEAEMDFQSETKTKATVFLEFIHKVCESI